MHKIFYRIRGKEKNLDTDQRRLKADKQNIFFCFYLCFICTHLRQILSSLFAFIRGSKGFLVSASPGWVS